MPSCRRGVGLGRVPIHAGDVGDADILPRLRTLAPVFAVRGNVDAGPWANALPETEVVEAGKVSIYVLHDVARSTWYPRPAASRR